MKIFAFAFAAVFLPAAAFAACYGSGSYQSCYDDSGNNYSIRRYGNTTYMDGYNSQTGSNWSQTSRRSGNFTFHDGYDSDGGSWSTMCGPYGCN